MQKVVEILVKTFAGKGINKKFPFFVVLFKKFASLGRETAALVRIPLESRLFVSSKDTALGFSLRFKGFFEPVQTRKFIKSVKKGDTVFDIGANVGYYTILASKLIGAKGKVYALEPDRKNIELLKKNIELNNCLNVEVVPLALGAENKISYFLSDRANPGESRISEKVTKQLVQVKTLDKLVKEKSIKKIDVIKLDVEGGEVDVLRGAKNLIATSKNLNIFVECNLKTLKEFGEDKTALIAFLKGSGFDINYIFNERAKSLRRFSHRLLKKILKSTGYTNILAIKSNKTEIKPFVSVLMTAYNAEKYVSEAIESILNQSYKNFEFIIVNDGSNDRTLELIKEYRNRDKRIKIVSLNRNYGPSYASNIGIVKAKGQYLFRMDADDISEKDRLEKQVRFLLNKPEISMLGGQCTLIGKDGKVIGKKEFPTKHENIYRSLFSRNPIQHPSCVINLLNLTKNAILHDGKSVLAHDLELVFLASKYGKLANLKDCVLNYRQYQESFSLRNPKKTFAATLAVRLGSVLKYGYRPSLRGILTIIVQFVIVMVLPNKWIFPFYAYIRGIKKVNFKDVKISWDVSFIKKAFSLVKA